MSVLQLGKIGGLYKVQLIAMQQDNSLINPLLIIRSLKKMVKHSFEGF